MKELSIEEKAKAYDKALAIARDFYNSTKYAKSHAEVKATYEAIFPELAESEDERIRKEIIYHIKNCDDTIDEKTEKRMIAWLKKQGEPTSIPADAVLNSNKDGLIADTVRYKREKQGDDKVESKFKVGDWVVVDDGRIGRIIECTKDFADVDLEFSCLSTRVKNIRSWTIQDAKDGDVLCTKNKCCPFIYDKGRYNNGLAYYYAGIDVSGNLNIKSPHNMLAHFGRLDNIRPATQEQRDLLFKKMKEAGYEWDAEKKELKKIEQKPVKVPKFKVGDFIQFNGMGHTRYTVKEVCGLSHYINSFDRRMDMAYTDTNFELVEQKPTEWSEEDIRKIDELIALCEGRKKLCSSTVPTYKRMDELKDWLKTLRPQSTWKPSDEQMEALEHFIVYHNGSTNYAKDLEELRLQLKKLREEDV